MIPARIISYDEESTMVADLTGSWRFRVGPVHHTAKKEEKMEAVLVGLATDGNSQYKRTIGRSSNALLFFPNVSFAFSTGVRKIESSRYNGH